MLYEVNDDDTPDELSHNAAAAIEILWCERDAQRATIERLENEIRELNIGKGSSITGQEADALKAEIERLKKDPLCQALTDPDCCCHSCLKDAAIEKWIKFEDESKAKQQTIEALAGALNDMDKLCKTAQGVLSKHLHPDSSQNADQTVDLLLGILDGPGWRAVHAQAHRCPSPSRGEEMKGKTINWIQFLKAKQKKPVKVQDVREILKRKEAGQ